MIKAKILMIFLIVLTIFLISCSSNQQIEPSCELFKNATDTVYEALGDYEFINPKSVETECRNLYLKKAINQELCTNDEAVYPWHCNQMVGYFAQEASVCISKNEDGIISCLQGFALNEKSDCEEFKAKKVNGQSLKEMCFYFKGLLGDESACEQINDETKKNYCLSLAKEANYNEVEQCGDGTCEYPESNWNCPDDCMTIPEELIVDNPPVCGDGICEELEDCTERLCTEGKEKCISTCPYGCPSECNYVKIMYGCKEGAESSNNIYTKESFTVFHYKNKQEEHCAIIEEEIRSNGQISKSIANHGEDCTGPECHVFETYCSNGNYQAEYVKCPNGCKDGACIK